jgi:hypothetical protein
MVSSSSSFLVSLILFWQMKSKNAKLVSRRVDAPIAEATISLKILPCALATLEEDFLEVVMTIPLAPNLSIPSSTVPSIRLYPGWY